MHVKYLLKFTVKSLWCLYVEQWLREIVSLDILITGHVCRGGLVGIFKSSAWGTHMGSFGVLLHEGVLSWHIDGSVQGCSISSALAVEIPQFCLKPLIPCTIIFLPASGEQIYVSYMIICSIKSSRIRTQVSQETLGFESWLCQRKPASLWY